MSNSQNQYNSKVTTFQLPIVGNPALTSGTDYTLDLATIYSQTHLRFTTANGSTTSPVAGPTLPFNVEDRPILKSLRLVSNFADGLVFTEHQITSSILINNLNTIASSGFSYTGSSPLNTIKTNIPILNTQIDISRFVPTTTFLSLPSNFNVANVLKNCAFMYFKAFSFTWNTNTIDSSYDGLTPKFTMEAEVEHTFGLQSLGGCNVV